MGPLIYDTRCTYTGSQIRFAWDPKRPEDFGLWLMRDAKGEEADTKGEEAPVVRRRRMRRDRMLLDVSADPVDVVAYCQAGLLRKPFHVWCKACDRNGSEWRVVFHSLQHKKYPGHSLVVRLQPAQDVTSEEAKVLPYFFLTVLDVVRVRDAFHRCSEAMSGERIVDSVIFYYEPQPRIRISGGREIPLTRIGTERLLQAMTEIFAMHVAGKQRVIGVRHGAFGVTNQVTKRFAVLSLSVAGWSIPLDWLNALRIYTHLSILSQRMWHEGGEIFNFDFDYETGDCDERSDHPDCAQIQVL